VIVQTDPKTEPVGSDFAEGVGLFGNANLLAGHKNSFSGVSF
jgi:hypothetical protein